MFILLNVNRYRHKIVSVSIRINKIQATKRSKDYTAVGKRFFDRPKVMRRYDGKTGEGTPSANASAYYPLLKFGLKCSLMV